MVEVSAATLTRLATPLDANWRLLGRCLDLDPDFMHPDDGDKSGLAAAKNVCDACPVVEQCLRDAEGDWNGVRGGLTGAERKARELAQAADVPTGPPMGCGICRVPRLQHTTKGHTYRPPAMKTALARAAALKNGSKAA